MITGSVQQKGGKFYLVVNAYIDGKRKPEWIPTGLPVRGNKKLAKELLEQELAKYNSGGGASKAETSLKSKALKAEGVQNAPAPQRRARTSRGQRKQDIVEYSLIEFCRKWLRDKKPCVEENTFASYEYQVERIIDYFKERNLMLHQLDPIDIHEFYQYLAQEGNQSNTGKRGKGLSARTIKDIAQRFRAILRTAASLRLIEENPSEKIDIPKPLDQNSVQDDEDLYMDEEELALLFNYTKEQEEPLHYLW